jgi:hypothetical protein
VLIRIFALLSLLLAPSAASSEAAFDRLFRFEDPYHCVPGKAFDAFLKRLIYWRKSGDTYRAIVGSPQVPIIFRNQVGKPNLAVKGKEYRVTVPLKGTWQHLPLRALVKIDWVESEGGFYLVFDATIEEVITAANLAGFRIPASHNEYRDAEVLGVNVGVEAFEGRSALYCIAG